MNLQAHTITLTLQEDTLQISIALPHQHWQSIQQAPYLLYHQKKLAFTQATQIHHSYCQVGLAKGILSDYQGFFNTDLHFQTLILISTSSEITFHFLPIKDEGVTEVFWPMPFTFDKASKDWYTLLPLQQGLLLPNTWKKEVCQLPFDGAFCSSSAYMPWLSQIKENMGYLLINDTPWDSAYQIQHPAHGPYTHVSIRWLSSLGKLSYRRSLRMQFYEHCDHNTIAKAYRKDAIARGLLVTLKEKSIQQPSLDELIGACFLHKGIQTHVQPQSRFYDAKKPDRYESLTTFATRRQEMIEWKQLGVNKLYLHLDGWGVEGYDNAHPSILPPCEKAGGWDGLQALCQQMKQLHYVFGLHDQYRDHYHLGKEYDPQNSVQLPDGSIPSHAYWAGGEQDYLCASLASSYVKRNYEALFAHGIYPDAVYLDVFTCNEPDECAHPMHRMTRRECLAYRNACFAWLLSKHILTSSEEVNEWALPYQIFAHYGPYHFMMHSPKEERIGIGVPLFNLVYHDCVLLPWPMDVYLDGEDLMLYALLNGGAPYLEKDGAYPNTDGVFDNEYKSLTKQEKQERSAIVSTFHTLVAKEEMVSHEFLDHDYKCQKTRFANGCEVTIDLRNNSYTLSVPAMDDANLSNI